MKKNDLSITKLIFVLFASVPYRVFRAIHFFYELPRRKLQFATAQKSVTFYRLSNIPVKALRAFDLTRELRAREGDGEWPNGKPPSLWELFAHLWDEEIDGSWKVPLVSELEMIRKELQEDFLRIPKTNSLKISCIWALDDVRHVYVGYDPLSTSQKQMSNIATPEDLSRSVLYGIAPDSKEEYFAYAVSVGIKK